MAKKKKSKKALLLLGLLLLGGVGAFALMTKAQGPTEAANINDVQVSIKVR